jgi:biopolymer transport protein ExbD
MAEVNTGDGGGGHGKHDKKRAKKASTKIDMTPMVDLAFLLLTFFVLTSTFNKAKTMEISFPAKSEDRQKVNNALTFILTREGKDEKEDGIYYYYGEFYAPNNPDGKPPTTFTKTDFSKNGLHKILLDRNKTTIEKLAKLEARYKKREIADTTYKRLATNTASEREAVTVLVKADDKAVYKNVVDAIDELNICKVGKYAIVDMSQPELDILNTIKKK